MDDRNALAEPPKRVDTYEDLYEEPGQPSVSEGSDPRRPRADRPEPRSPEPHPPEPHSEDIRKIQVDDEDRLAFRVGVNALTLVLLGFGIWLLITYVF